MQVAVPLSPFHIRLASLSDLSAICRIENNSFPTPYPRSLLKRLLDDCSDGFFVATDDAGKLVGYCVCSSSSRSAHLISIAVHTDCRRKGVATSLLLGVVGSLKEHDVVELWLEVNLKNVAAVTLYSKLGFEKMAMLKGYYSDGSDAGQDAFDYS